MTRKEQNNLEVFVQNKCADALEHWYEAQDDEVLEAFYCGIWGAYKEVCEYLGIPYPYAIEKEQVVEA